MILPPFTQPIQVYECKKIKRRRARFASLWRFMCSFF